MVESVFEKVRDRRVAARSFPERGKIRAFLLTKAWRALFYLSCDKRIPQARGVLPSSGSSRSLSGLMNEVGFCFVLKELRSLTVWSRISGVGSLETAVP